MRTNWLAETFSILLVLFNEVKLDNIAGPFDVIVKHSEPCDDAGTGEIAFSLKFRKSSRTATAFDCSIRTKYPLDDNNSITLVVGQFTNNGIKENFFQREFAKGCSTLDLFLPTIKKQFAKKLGLKDCPVPPGNYTVRNVDFTDTLRRIPIFFYNKYRVEILLKREKKLVGCFALYVDIVPKRRNSRS